jgi:hypothetical protein
MFTTGHKTAFTGHQSISKIKKGQNRHSPHFKIQYPMKNLHQK